MSPARTGQLQCSNRFGWTSWVCQSTDGLCHLIASNVCLFRISLFTLSVQLKVVSNWVESKLTFNVIILGQSRIHIEMIGESTIEESRSPDCMGIDQGLAGESCACWMQFFQGNKQHVCKHTSWQGYEQRWFSGHSSTHEKHCQCVSQTKVLSVWSCMHVCVHVTWGKVPVRQCRASDKQ